MKGRGVPGYEPGRKADICQGHPEYDRMTLNNEYHRDLKKGLNPEVPYNYYEDNDPFFSARR